MFSKKVILAVLAISS